MCHIPITVISRHINYHHHNIRHRSLTTWQELQPVRRECVWESVNKLYRSEIVKEQECDLSDLISNWPGHDGQWQTCWLKYFSSLGSVLVRSLYRMVRKIKTSSEQQIFLVDEWTHWRMARQEGSNLNNHSLQPCWVESDELTSRRAQ